MNKDERAVAINQMREAVHSFYHAAQRIGNHPFIEFTGLMGEYVKACELAHEKGVDFSDCSTHSGIPLPMSLYMVRYINEKLECIFTGRSVMDNDPMRPIPDATDQDTQARLHRLTEQQRQDAIDAAIWITASAHEWKWTEAQQQAMARYCVAACSELDYTNKAIRKVAEKHPEAMSALMRALNGDDNGGQ